MNGKKKLLVYKLALIFIAVMLMILPGAADKNPQIDSRIMITSIGLDTSDEGLELTAAVTVPSGGGGKESTASATGKTFGETVNKLSRALGKRVELAHCALVAFGKELCERGIKDEVGYLITTGGISDGASLVVADGKAKELITTAAGLSEGAAFSLGSFITFASEDAQVPMKSLIRFAADNENLCACGYLPILKMGGDKKQGGESGGSGGQSGGGSGSSGQSGGGSGSSGESGSGGGSQGESSSGESGGNSSSEGGGNSGSGGGQSGGSQGDQSQISSSERTMIFKDYKAVGELDEENTFALTWLDPQADRGVVNLKNFEIDGESYGQFTFVMRKKGVKVRSEFDDGVPVITISMKAQLEPHNNNRISGLRDEKGITVREITKHLKKQLEDQLSKQFQDGWENAKKLEADPFRYGLSLYKKDPKKYEEIIKDHSDLFALMVLKTDIDLLLI